MSATSWAWARAVGAAGIIGLLVWHLGTDAFVAGLHVIDGRTLLLATAIGLVSTAFSAWRWALVAHGLGLTLPLRTAVADYYRALFLNAALPGGVLGDVHRAVQHGRDNGDVGRGVRAVVLERTAGQIMLAAVALTVLLAVPSPLPRPVLLTIIAIAAVAVVAIALVGWLRPKHATTRWSRALAVTVADTRRGLFGGTNTATIAVSSAVVLAGHLATFLVAARAAGSTASIGQLLPIALLALLAMAVPLNIAGWGPREGITAWAFGAAGLGASLGLTTAVVYGVLAFVASLPGAAILIARWATARHGHLVLWRQAVSNRSESA